MLTPSILRILAVMSFGSGYSSPARHTLVFCRSNGQAWEHSSSGRGGMCLGLIPFCEGIEVRRAGGFQLGLSARFQRQSAQAVRYKEDNLRIVLVLQFTRQVVNGHFWHQASGIDRQQNPRRTSRRYNQRSGIVDERHAGIKGAASSGHVVAPESRGIDLQAWSAETDRG